MSSIGILQVSILLTVIFLLVKPLGLYMAMVYQGKTTILSRFLSPLENAIYRICGIRSNKGMRWQHYLISMLLFNVLGIVVLFILQRLQFYLPLNPNKFPAPSPLLAFNTAVSFATNTNWQSYSGESSLSYLTQMLGLTVQNFISAATGLSVFVALCRGIARREHLSLGNFWVDTLRGILYILLPFSIILSIFLSTQGVIQNFKPPQVAKLIQPFVYQGTRIETQVIPQGPVASQVAIKQLGSNGGGFFNANAAHPYENPTPLSNFVELLAILLIPASLCYTFGVLVRQVKQGVALLVMMSILFIPLLLGGIIAEEHGNPLLKSLPIVPGPNLEGKELRFGVTSSAMWAMATTATSNGSVNSMLSSYSPLGSLIPLWFMHLGEVIFGGLGSGLYGLFLLVIMSVFVAGLMVGRTPEFLGKKIEPYEMKMASFAVLLMPIWVLTTTAVALVSTLGIQAIDFQGPHGFTEVLYAFSSMANNNGSAMSGLHANTSFYNLLGAVIMFINRYWMAIAVLAIAGSLAKKKYIPQTAGTLSTYSPLFIMLLVGITVILGALSFLPGIALGPIVQALFLRGFHG